MITGLLYPKESIKLESFSEQENVLNTGSISCNAAQVKPMSCKFSSNQNAKQNANWMSISKPIIKRPYESQHTMANFVDGKLFCLLQVAILTKCFLWQKSQVLMSALRTTKALLASGLSNQEYTSKVRLLSDRLNILF